MGKVAPAPAHRCERATAPDVMIANTPAGTKRSTASSRTGEASGAVVVAAEQLGRPSRDPSPLGSSSAAKGCGRFSTYGTTNSEAGDLGPWEASHLVPMTKKCSHSLAHTRNESS